MSRPNYGSPVGLPARLADWLNRCKYDKSLPWVGCGLVADLEAVVRLLTLEEFGNWLRLHDDGDLQQWGAPVLKAAGERDRLLAVIDEHLPEGETATEAVAIAGTTIADVRKVLVECGALEEADQHTDIAGLLRVLLA